MSKRKENEFEREESSKCSYHEKLPEPPTAERPKPSPLPVKDKAKSDERFASFARRLVQTAIMQVREQVRLYKRPPLRIDSNLHVRTEAGEYNVILELIAPNQVAISGIINDDL